MTDEEMDAVRSFLPILRSKDDPRLSSMIARLSWMVGECSCGKALTEGNASGPFGDVCDVCWNKTSDWLMELAEELGLEDRAREMLDRKQGCES